jgi:hypothetical protein
MEYPLTELATNLVDFTPFPKMTAAFISDRESLTWADLHWAAGNGWLTDEALLDFADSLAANDDDLRVEVNVAASSADDQELQAVIEREASIEAASPEAIREKWMDLAVAWLYENRKLLPDPLAEVEQLWAAFGHPSNLNHLIRSAPTEPGAALGDAAIMNRWRTAATRPMTL